MTQRVRDSQDEAIGKGAVESDGLRDGNKGRTENESLSGQLGHRDQDPMLKGNDTDFPEPDAEAEHSGSH